jgi:hypothetical protein
MNFGYLILLGFEVDAFLFFNFLFKLLQLGAVGFINVRLC